MLSLALEFILGTPVLSHNGQDFSFREQLKDWKWKTKIICWGNDYVEKPKVSTKLLEQLSK